MAPLAPACDESAAPPDLAGEQPFVEQMLAGTDVEVLVHAEGAPVSGAIVHVRQVSADGAIGPVFVTTRSDAEGVARGVFSRPVDLEEVAIVVVAEGYLDPHHEEVARPMAEFAPAARRVVAVTDEVRVSVELDVAGAR